MEIVDLDELVPDDIAFKYRGAEWRIPGDLRTDQTLELYALLHRLAGAEATGTASELKRIIGQAEKALLPIFQVHHPELTELPFGAAGLGAVLRRVLALIGLLQEAVPDPQPPAPTPNRAQRRARKTPTKPGSKPQKAAAARRTGSNGSKS